MEVLDYKKILDKCSTDAGMYTTYFALLLAFGNGAVIEWCVNEGLIASKLVCPKCANDMKLSRNASFKNAEYEWCCRLNGHDVTRSIRKASWFDRSNLSIPVILKVMHKLFGQCMQTYCIADVNVTDKTVWDWYNFCREVCMTVILNATDHIGSIGKKWMKASLEK